MKNSALLVVSFYLSKFGSKADAKAYIYLGYKNASESFSSIAEVLGLPKNTVKNTCDTFDPLHGHRQGWHQRELQPRFKKIAEALKDVSEADLAEICKKILTDKTYRESEGYLSNLIINADDDFEDISQLYRELKDRASKLYLLDTDQALSFDFMEKIRDAAKDSHVITFSKYCSKLIINRTRNKLDVPNIAFYKAVEAQQLSLAITEINDAFVAIYDKLKAEEEIAFGDAEKFYVALILPENADTIKKTFTEEAEVYLSSIGKSSIVSLDRFNKFIYDKKWKTDGEAAGKNPGRGDVWVSSILKAFGTSAANQGFISELASILMKVKVDWSAYSLLFKGAIAPDSNGPKNLIVYGAPGTGKSFYIKSLLDDKNTITTVFHSETQNSDFVGSLKPVTVGVKVTYEFIPGPFINAFVAAIQNSDEQIYLVIEEINRANAAAVFGEVFQLLDRTKEGRSEYSIKPDVTLAKYLEEVLKSAFDGELFLPPNLIINATMNSSDQGVYPLDSAFKRRWSFKYIPIDFQSCPLGSINLDERTLSWEILAKSINEVLSAEYAHLEEDRFIGPWFLNSEEVQSSFSSAVESKLFTYLWNDVLRHQDKYKIFNEQAISTFGDLIRTYHKQLYGQSVYLFSNEVHARFDHYIELNNISSDDLEEDNAEEDFVDDESTS